MALLTERQAEALQDHLAEARREGEKMAREKIATFVAGFADEVRSEVIAEHIRNTPFDEM